MIESRVKAAINAGAPEVWGSLRDFNGLPKFVRGMTSSVEGAGPGAVRTLTMPDGGTVVERLERLDDNDMSLSYSIVRGTLEADDYLATIRVRVLGPAQCEVDWSSRCTPRGPHGEAIKSALEALYAAGVKGLKRLHEGPTKT